MLYFVLFSILFTALWFLNSWVQNHALAVAVGTTWTIQSAGWEALLTPILIGGIVGLVVGVSATPKLIEAIERLIAEKQSEAANQAVEEHAKLQAERAELKKALQTAEQQGWKHADEALKNSRLQVYAAQERERAALASKTGLERRLKHLEGRLIGAQQKAARKAKKGT